MNEVERGAPILMVIAVAGLVLSVFFDYPYAGVLQRFCFPVLLYSVTLYALGSSRVRSSRILILVSLLPTFVALAASSGLAWLYLVGLTINSRPSTVFDPVLTVVSITVGILVIRTAIGSRRRL